jgi:ribonuclease HI
MSFKLELFDGKGVTGAGGVIFDFKGNKVLEFAWGLGNATNNHAEVLATYMGLRLIPENRSTRLMVISDSDLIIRGLCKSLKTMHPNISKTLLRIKDMESKFDKISYYHVLQTHNIDVDSLAKEYTFG